MKTNMNKQTDTTETRAPTIRFRRISFRSLLNMYCQQNSNESNSLHIKLIGNNNNFSLELIKKNKNRQRKQNNSNYLSINVENSTSFITECY